MIKKIFEIPKNKKLNIQINFNDVTGKDRKKSQSRLVTTFLYPYMILIVGSSGSGKTNGLLNLIHHKPDIDKLFSCVKDPY